MEEKYYLVIADGCWADEFDIFGFNIFTEAEWAQVKEDWKYLNFPCEWYFGTNEAMEWDSVEDLQSDFTVKEITSSEKQVIEKVFGKHGCGQFPGFDECFYEQYDDEAKEYKDSRLRFQ